MSSFTKGDSRSSTAVVNTCPFVALMVSQFAGSYSLEYLQEIKYKDDLWWLYTSSSCYYFEPKGSTIKKLWLPKRELCFLLLCASGQALVNAKWLFTCYNWIWSCLDSAQDFLHGDGASRGRSALKTSDAFCSHSLPKSLREVLVTDGTNFLLRLTWVRTFKSWVSASISSGHLLYSSSYLPRRKRKQHNRGQQAQTIHQKLCFTLYTEFLFFYCLKGHVQPCWKPCLTDMSSLTWKKTQVLKYYFILPSNL